MLGLGLGLYQASTNIGSVPPTPPSFDPSQLENLVLWLDASDASTITESGGKVSNWADKSTIGNNFYNADTNSQPLYDAVNSVVDFSTATSRLFNNLRLPNTATIIGAYGSASGESTGTFAIGDGGSALIPIGLKGSGNPEVYRPAVASVNDYKNNVALNLTTRSDAWYALFDPVDTELIYSVDNADLRLVDTVGSRFGSNDFKCRDIYELIITSQPITEQERLDATQYLADKWNIAI